MVDLLNNPSILSSLVLPRKSFCLSFFFLAKDSLFFKIIGGKIPTLLGGLGGSRGISLSLLLNGIFGTNFGAIFCFGLIGSGVGDLNFCGCACFNARGCLVERIGDILVANTGDVLVASLGVILVDCAAMLLIETPVISLVSVLLFTLDIVTLSVA